MEDSFNPFVSVRSVIGGYIVDGPAGEKICQTLEDVLREVRDIFTNTVTSKPVQLNG